MNFLVPLNPLPVRKVPGKSDPKIPKAAKPKRSHSSFERAVHNASVTSTTTMPEIYGDRSLYEPPKKKKTRSKTGARLYTPPPGGPTTACTTNEKDIQFKPSKLIDGFLNEQDNWRTLHRTRISTDYDNKVITSYVGTRLEKKPPAISFQDERLPLEERQRRLMEQLEARGALAPDPDDGIIKKVTATYDYAGKRIICDPVHRPIPAMPMERKDKYLKIYKWTKETY